MPINIFPLLGGSNLKYSSLQLCKEVWEKSKSQCLHPRSLESHISDIAQTTRELGNHQSSTCHFKNIAFLCWGSLIWKNTLGNRSMWRATKKTQAITHYTDSLSSSRCGLEICRLMKVNISLPNFHSPCMRTFFQGFLFWLMGRGLRKKISTFMSSFFFSCPPT